jgi:DNA-3-methyladenine glycosylase I
VENSVKFEFLGGKSSGSGAEMASMAGAPRVRSLNIAAPEVEARPVLVPGGNKARSGPANARKPSPKPLRKAEPAAARTPEKPAAAAAKEEEGAKRNAVGGGGAGAPKGASPVPSPRRTPPGPPPRRNDAPPLQPSLPLSASCSSDASVESIRTRVFAGKAEKGRSWAKAVPKQGKSVGKVAESKLAGVDFVCPVTLEAGEGKRRCAWATPTTGELHPFFKLFFVKIRVRYKNGYPCFLMFW